MLPIKIINRAYDVFHVNLSIFLVPVIFSMILFGGYFVEVSASQMTVSLVPDTDKADAVFTATRFVTLEYEPESVLAKQFNGKNERVEFSLNGTENGMDQLINTINSNILREKASNVKIQNATLDYTGSLRGSPNKLSLTYKIVLEAILSNFSHPAQQAKVVDLDWRGIVVKEPLPVSTQQYGNLSINYPIGLLQATYPQFAEAMLKSSGSQIMRDPMFNFQDIAVPMDRWHFLFDPTGSQAGAAGSGFSEVGGARVVSIYSLGESSFREGTFSEKINVATATVNGTKINIESSTPPPSGQIQIAGFSKLQKSGNNELAFVTAEAPEGTVTATGGFPIQVLLVLGGMMGAVAVFVLLKTRK